MKTTKQRAWRALIWIFGAVFIAFLLSGCASMNSSKEELQSVGENEGIVVGSVLLTLPQEKANESAWAFLRGRKAGGVEYQVMVDKFDPAAAARNFIQSFGFFDKSYYLQATLGKEVYFVKKLPAGKYWIRNIGPIGPFVPTDMLFRLELAFDVKPQTLSYIGKLVVTLPDRLGFDSRVEFTVQDAQQEMIARLGNDYLAILPNAVKQLAGHDQSSNIVPEITITSAGAVRGVISGDKYTSPRKWFSVQVPTSSNSFGVPFSINDDSLNTPDANYDLVTFSVKDFGELLIAGVDYFPDEFIEKEMNSDDHRTVLSKLSNMALHIARHGQGFPIKPKAVEEMYLDTPYGEALFRIYMAEKGSLLARTTGRSMPTAADTLDTLIAVIVAKQKNNFIYAIAENDAESDGTDRNKEALKERIQLVFASMAVHR